MKQCVLIQGPLYENSIEHLINDYSAISDKVISTWNDQNPDAIRRLEENGFKMILNEIPSVRNSKTYQTTSIMAGIAYIKSMGDYTHVLRMRSDVHCNDIAKVLSIFGSYDEEKPTFLTWFRNNNYEGGI